MTAPAMVGAGDVVHYNPTPMDIDTGMPGGCRDALVMAVYLPTWPAQGPRCLALLVDAGDGETAQVLSPHGPDVGSALMPGCWHYPGSWWRR